MKKIFLSAIAVSTLFFSYSCNTDFDTDVTEIVATSGDADFSRYVALGNSLTSGFRDNALYIDGQVESYPNMIAMQMKRAGGGDFTQPLMPDNVGGFSNFVNAAGTFLFPGKLNLQVVDVLDGAGTVVGKDLSPIPSRPENAFGTVTGSYGNLGVPGAKSFHLLASGYGNPAGISTGTANPYFARFATSTTTSVLRDAIAVNPTFFSLWIGNNDVLSYATSGGVGTDQTGNQDVTSYGSNDITDPTVFAGSIKGILDGMASVGATKGVIANIPNVENIPFFTTVPIAPLTAYAIGKNNQAAGETTIDQVNVLYGAVKQVLTALGQGDRINLLSKTTANPLLIRDETLTDLSTQITAALTQSLGAPTAYAVGLAFGQARQTKAGDLVPLTTRSVIGTAPNTTTYPYAQAPLNAYGITFPLDDQYILIPSEITAIRTATTAYNASIKSLADAYGLAFVDANAKMVELSKTSGIQYDGVKYTATFVTGGSFSLDGVHLTGRGYAVIANEFIKAINTTYKSTLPEVNPNHYSGVKFP
ncbi:MAG: G-D-S-L family lipolytic protein [Cruoricaptor ignavus]|nr:G-D-S-L family lipolytic protein [Cruoricaptor ignavus]